MEKRLSTVNDWKLELISITGLLEAFEGLLKNLISGLIKATNQLWNHH